MKRTRQEKMIDILEKADSWVSASTLASMLGVSERTVRNYVTQLGPGQILSSRVGYRLAPRSAVPASSPVAENDERVTRVLVRLLRSGGPVSIFDLADELAVSESTITNLVLPEVRRQLSPFSVKLRVHSFELELEGSEQERRRLLGFLATRGTYGYFSSTKTLAEMFPEFDVDLMLQQLVETCQESELLLNNYALNNLLVHMLVIIIRLKSKNELGQAESDVAVDELVDRVRQHDEVARFASNVVRICEQNFDVTIPNRDFQQILMLVALSTDRCDYASLDHDKLSHLMGEQFVSTIRDVARETTKHYGLPPFEESFLLQLTMHMYNAYQRTLFKVSCPNPIACQIKQSYAPIYDMAVFFAHRFQDSYGLKLSEDEMGFVAFHMGAYLERHRETDERVSCCVVVESYHDFGEELVASIRERFHDDLVLDAVMSYDEFLKAPTDDDLVITTIHLPQTTSGHVVLISPIMGRKDVARIRSQVEAIGEERTAGRGRLFLRQLIDRHLFARNVELESVDAYIDFLGSLCLEQGVIDEDFLEDVKLRERLSGTAFTPCLAVPHSVGKYALKSFVCVIHNDAPIPWGAGSVNFVMLIGLTQQDMKSFQDAFGIIIECFSDADCTSRMLRSDGYDEFETALLGEGEE